MKRLALLCLTFLCLALLSSCGMFARYASDFEMPVEETEQVVERVSFLPRYDFNDDGMIDAAEFDTFLTNLATWAIATFAAAPPPDPTKAEVEL